MGNLTLIGLIMIGIGTMLILNIITTLNVIKYKKLVNEQRKLIEKQNKEKQYLLHDIKILVSQADDESFVTFHNVHFKWETRFLQEKMIMMKARRKGYDSRILFGQGILCKIKPQQIVRDTE